MNKIRVIDLLNKIANSEDVPKKISYAYIGKNFFDFNGKTYIDDSGSSIIDYINSDLSNLNEEVGIEDAEEDKEIEKWGNGALEEIKTKKDYKINDLQLYIAILMETQNKLIDIVNKLNKKGE